MKQVSLMAALMMGLSVSACSSVDTAATRAAPLEAETLAPVGLSLDVQAVRVTVPRSLKVSEANRYYPGSDIVWREDGPGDRHVQVQAIFQNAIEQGVSNLPVGGVPVVLDIEVTRFHALTEKARYSVGGVHALQFNMVLRNPETGETYGEPQFVKADFRALGGQQAIKAESQGVTQKVRITEQLAKVIQVQLSDPNGYQAAQLGLMGALNQI